MKIFSQGASYPKLPSNGNYWISETAILIDEVELKVGSSVWFGAVIRGDNEKILIGPYTNIQENCILHTDPGYPISIGSNCTIGHGAILHGCSIGNNCIIGMGSIILNGAILGNDCIVGAGSLLTEEKNFLESGKLILGSPAKVIRDLRAPEMQNIRDSAQGYAKKAKRYKEKFKAKKM